LVQGEVRPLLDAAGPSECLQFLLVFEVDALDVLYQPVLGEMLGCVIYRGRQSTDLGHEFIVDLLVGGVVWIVGLLHHSLFISKVVFGCSDERSQVSSVVVSAAGEDGFEELSVFIIQVVVKDFEAVVPLEWLRYVERHDGSCMLCCPKTELH